MTADHTSTANVHHHEIPHSEWTNIHQGSAPGYNYDPSKENMDEEDIYGAVDMDEMDMDLPEEPQNYFQPLNAPSGAYFNSGDISSTQFVPHHGATETAPLNQFDYQSHEMLSEMNRNEMHAMSGTGSDRLARQNRNDYQEQ